MVKPRSSRGAQQVARAAHVARGGQDDQLAGHGVATTVSQAARTRSGPASETHQRVSARRRSPRRRRLVRADHRSTRSRRRPGRGGGFPSLLIRSTSPARIAANRAALISNPMTRTPLARRARAVGRPTYPTDRQPRPSGRYQTRMDADPLPTGRAPPEGRRRRGPTAPPAPIRMTGKPARRLVNTARTPPRTRGLNCRTPSCPRSNDPFTSPTSCDAGPSPETRAGVQVTSTKVLCQAVPIADRAAVAQRQHPCSRGCRCRDIVTRWRRGTRRPAPRFRAPCRPRGCRCR